MNEFNKKEKREFLLNLYESDFIPPLKKAFAEIIGAEVKALFFDEEFQAINKNGARISKNLLKKLKFARPKKIVTMELSEGKYSITVPIFREQELYGYIVLLDIKRVPDKKESNFISIFIDISLREFNKCHEIKNLYDTIKPRAIALSTIHTIHRLLSSTLEMDELIERIARLTLQVMRSKYCCIMMISDSKKYLIYKAVIDLKNQPNNIQKKYRKIKIGTTRISKVAKTGKTYLDQNSICVPLVEEDIIGIICAKNKIDNGSFRKFDMEILNTLAEQAVIAIKNAQLYEEQKKMSYGSIKSLAALLDAKSPHTYTHSELFIKIVLAIAEIMKLPREEIRHLRFAALLPDTGKFSIPDDILKKRGGLSKKEFNIIKKQHLESLKILEPLEFLKPVIPIIMHHHERYDGTGYPKRLKGGQIPIGARIMAVADAFEAMISSRPYKEGRISMPQALKEITDNKRSQFDPDVVDAFIAVLKNPDFQKLL